MPTYRKKYIYDDFYTREAGFFLTGPHLTNHSIDESKTLFQAECIEKEHTGDYLQFKEVRLLLVQDDLREICIDSYFPYEGKKRIQVRPINQYYRRFYVNQYEVEITTDANVNNIDQQLLTGLFTLAVKEYFRINNNIEVAINNANFVNLNNSNEFYVFFWEN